ncbi:hypothetical protein BD413DRAFT_656225 [Trametes elegans]|nr:hypothetical protein BD413DRAFT_656225 [Trametes elegans]
MTIERPCTLVRLCPLTDVIDFLTSTPGVVAHIHHFLLQGYNGIGLRAIIAEISALRVHFVTNSGSYLDHLLLLLGLFITVGKLHLSEQSLRWFLVPFRDGLPKLDMHHVLRTADLSLSTIPAPFITQLAGQSRLPHWGTLRSLHLDHCPDTWDEVGEVGKLLAEIGPGFRRLWVSPSSDLHSLDLTDLQWTTTALDDMRASPDWAALDLSRCTNLDVFALNLVYGQSAHRYNVENIFNLHVDLLAQLPKTIACVKLMLTPAPT